MTDARITELYALCEAATEGPWTFDEGFPGGLIIAASGDVCSYMRSDNAHFIAEIRTALPELLDEVVRLNAAKAGKR